MPESRKDQQDHPPVAPAPGASGPGEPAYEGRVTLGDEGAAAGPESFVDSDAGPEAAREAVTDEVAEQWDRAERKREVGETDPADPAGPEGERS